MDQPIPSPFDFSKDTQICFICKTIAFFTHVDYIDGFEHYRCKCGEYSYKIRITDNKK